MQDMFGGKRKASCLYEEEGLCISGQRRNQKEEEALVLSDDDNNNDKGTDFCHVTALQQSTVNGCVQTTVVYSLEHDRSLLITHGTRQLGALDISI